jgi:hypothetical protein
MLGLLLLCRIHRNGVSGVVWTSCKADIFGTRSGWVGTVRHCSFETTTEPRHGVRIRRGASLIPLIGDWRDDRWGRCRSYPESD